MWIQKQYKAPEPEVPDTLFINKRGRVILVKEKDVSEARKKGFIEAPRDTEPGSYFEDFDLALKTISNES